jgi:hypothetical protein
MRRCQHPRRTDLHRAADRTPRPAEGRARTCGVCVRGPRQAIGRIGLPAVREHRRKRLQQEHDARMAALDDMEASVPDLNAVMMVRVSGDVMPGGQVEMSQWSERILSHFTADLTRLWVACDPDDVLLDEKLLSELRGRGFEVMLYEDPFAFRAEFEERYRAAWDRGEPGASALAGSASAQRRRE